MDAVVTRRCPICGQKMEINEPRDYSRAVREHMKSAHPENYAWSRRLRRMIIPLVVLIPVLAFTPAILEPELGYAPAFALSITGFIIPLAVIGFMARRALRKGQGASTPTRLGDLPDTSSMLLRQASQSAVSYVAQDIVGIVKDLAQKLEISGLSPDSVSWQDYFVRTGFSFSRSNRPVMVPYDGCLFKGNQIIMPESSRDKLLPEEWAPLIASELVYQRKLLEKRRLGLLIRILPLTALYIIIPVILWQVGILNLQGSTTVRGAPTPVWLAFFEVYSGTALIFAMILYGLLGFRFNKQMRLKADAIAASLTGKAVFLSTLEKVGRAFPSIMTKGRPSMTYPPGRPSVMTRIEGVRVAAAF
jgi:hypothetical protein